MLSLEDEELDAVLEIDDEYIAKENGVDVITERWTDYLRKTLESPNTEL